MLRVEERGRRDVFVVRFVLAVAGGGGGGGGGVGIEGAARSKHEGVYAHTDVPAVILNALPYEHAGAGDAVDGAGLGRNEVA